LIYAKGEQQEGRVQRRRWRLWQRLGKHDGRREALTEQQLISCPRQSALAHPGPSTVGPFVPAQHHPQLPLLLGSVPAQRVQEPEELDPAEGERKVHAASGSASECALQVQ